MHFELGADEAQFRRTDQSGMGDPDAEQFAIKLRVPEIQEGFQLWKAWSVVVLLPDVALQKLRIIRQAIQNFRGRQAEASKLGAESRTGILNVQILTGQVVLSRRFADDCASRLETQKM